MQRSMLALISSTCLMCASSVATAQFNPADLNGTGFFAAPFMERIQQTMSSIVSIGDKNSPWTKELPDGYGTLYLFQAGQDTLLVVHGTKSIGLGESVVNPAGSVGLSNFMAIYSKNGTAVAKTEFPSALMVPLIKLWRANATSIQLVPKGFVVRAEPYGDILDGLKGFLSVDVQGRSVVDYEKSSKVNSTGVLIFGRVERPFKMALTLTDPEVTFTKKADGTLVVALASTVDVANGGYSHRYLLRVQGSKAKVPDIFMLRTSTLDPQDIVELSRALSEPLYGIPGTGDLRMRFDLIPTFSLNPPNSMPSKAMALGALPFEKQVVIFAAVANRPEWNIKAPGLTIFADLKMDLLLKQRLASVEAEADRDGLDMSFAVGNFYVPGADVSFGEATAKVAVGTSTASLGITASSPNACFQQKFGFTMNAKGDITADANVNQTLKNLGPQKFMENMKGCANSFAGGTLWAARWALITGDYVLGFGEDALMQAATPIFGAETVANAAKIHNYPRKVIAKALSTVVDKDALIDIGKKLYGDGYVAAFAKEAGYSAEDFFNWSNKNLLAKIGPRPLFRSWADIGKNVTWVTAHSAGMQEAGKMVGKVWPKDETLDASKKVFDAGWGGVASVGRAAGYTAEDVTHYFYARGVGGKDIADVLELGGYASNEAVGAMKSVYHMTEKEAEDLWNNISEGGKKVCKTILGWTRIC